MECLFLPEFKVTDHDVTVRDEELRHARALRLQSGESVLICNGAGLGAECRVATTTKDSLHLLVERHLPRMGELPHPIGLAMGLLKDRERLEFAVEKGVEFGMSDFYPLTTDFGQRQTVNTSRLQAKAIAAMKQCHRSRLPTIHPAGNLDRFFADRDASASLYVAAMDGSHPPAQVAGPTILLVGPEGGFSPREQALIESQTDSGTIVLAKRRLRAETAAVLGLGLLASLCPEQSG